MSLLIDLAILALLGGTLGYAFLVDRRVRKLVEILRDLEPVVGEFSAAVDKSEDSVTALKSMARSLEVEPRREPALARRNAPPPLATGAATAPGSAASNGQAGPAGDDGAPAFRSRRQAPPRPAGVAAVTGKADLVRGFFDTVRSRDA